MTTAVPTALLAEMPRRGTFAIISHPDAGNTSLTENLLLYAGASREAGAVRARRRARASVDAGRPLAISLSEHVLRVLTEHLPGLDTRLASPAPAA